jgi:hypothetical protein
MTFKNNLKGLNMVKKKKTIKPQFYYDKNKKPVAVYLGIEDYTLFMNKLKKFSDEARSQAMKQKKKR